MSSAFLMPLARRAGFSCVAVMAIAGVAFASSPASQDSSQTPPSAPAINFAAGNWSSSLATEQVAEFRAPAALPSAPAPSASAGQYGNNSRGGMWHHGTSGLAFEAGLGFNAPESDSIGWGWNLQIGAGVHAGEHFTPMIEYQFIHTGLAQYLIDAVGSDGGFTHIWSFGIDPVYDFAPKATNDFYIKGGGGFYRKVTNFTDAQQGEYCDYFYGCYGVTQNVVIDHFSSNQGGWNIGGGYYHRFGGIYGTGKMKFFAEARYLDVMTPAVAGVGPGGAIVTAVPADTKLIPVTFGFSW